MTAFLDFITDEAGTIGLIFFLTIFSVIVVWVSRPGAGERFKAHGDIPFRESDAEEAHNHD